MTKSFAMLSRSMLAAGLALATLAGCGQRQHVSLASGQTAAEPTMTATDATDTSEQPAARESAATAAPPASPAEAPAAPQSSPAEAPATAAPADAPAAPDTTAARDDPSPVAEEPAETADPGAALWERSFSATSVEVSGRPQPVEDGTELYVMPFRSHGNGGIRYHAGCNTGGASLRITADRFVVADDGAMSSAACSEPVMEQEQWYVDFIHTSPRWRLSADGTRLRLTSDDTVAVR